MNNTFVQVNDSYRNHRRQEGAMQYLGDNKFTSDFVNYEYDNDEKKLVNVSDAAFGFLSNELAKLIPGVYAPITNFTWEEDIPYEVGGGLVDYVEYFEVDYKGIIKDAKNLFANRGNDIPTVNASFSQKFGKVWTYEIAYDLEFVELEKLYKTRLGKNIKQVYTEIVQLGWDAMIQQLCYFGDPMGTETGLFNSDNKVMSISFDNVWTKDMPNAEIIAEFNQIEQDRFDAMGTNDEAYTRYLVPSKIYSILASKTTDLLNTTLLQFLKEHSLAALNSGTTIEIVARPQLNTLGAGERGRIVAYNKQINRVRLDIPYMLQVFATLPNAQTMSYRTFFVGQVGQLILPYSDNNRTMGGVAYAQFSA